MVSKRKKAAPSKASKAGGVSKKKKSPTIPSTISQKSFAKEENSQPLCDLKKDWPHMLLVFAILLGVYGYTAPDKVILEDDGEFIQAVYFLGIAHPPGYPLYVLLAHPFVYLPFGTITWRVHFASGFFGALGCAVLWWIARTLIRSRLSTAYVAALSFGFSRVFWSQAIISEVYTFNLLLFNLQLALSLGYLESKRPSLLCAIALVFCCAMSAHWPLYGLATPCLALILLPAHKTILRQISYFMTRILLLVALGLLSPYLWMVWRSRTAPEMTFAGSMDSWEEFVSYVRRDMFANNDVSPTAGVWDKMQFAGFMLREVVSHQFTILGAALAGVGFVAQWRYWRLSFCLGFLSAFLGTTFVLILMLGFDYEYLYQAVYKVYPVIPYAIMSLWLALGIDRVEARLFRSMDFAIGHDQFSAIVGVLVIVATFSTNWKYNNRRDYTFAHDFAMTLLESFEPNATVFMKGDSDSFTMACLHTVDGVRPDLTLINVRGVLIMPEHPGARLFSPKILPTDEAMEQRIGEYMDSHQGPFYSTGEDKYPHPMHTLDHGFYKKISTSEQDYYQVVKHDEGSSLRQLFRRVANYSDSTDQWTVYLKGNLIDRYSQVLAVIVHLEPNITLADQYRPDLDLACRFFHGLFVRIQRVALHKYARTTMEETMEWIEMAEGMLDETINKETRSILYQHKAGLLQDMGKTQEAAATFEKAFYAYPHPNNIDILQRSQKLLGMTS